MGFAAKAPDFLQGVIAGLREMGTALRAFRPDLLVLQSAHWVTTFPWYATCQVRHRGVCVADEAPDLIPGIAYDRPGAPEFAGGLIDRLAAAGLPAGRNDSPHYAWDYGTCVPLQYLDPEAGLPVVTLSTCLAADLQECMTVGRIVREAAEASGKRVVFIASTAFAHLLVRGPATQPPAAHQAADRRLLDHLRGGDVAAARAEFESYARTVHAEMGGRPLATFLGTLDGGPAGRQVGATYGSYGQSSGSGNISLAVWPIAA